MDRDPIEKALQLGQQIYESPTAVQYRAARERAFSDPDTATMLSRQSKLRMTLEGETIANGRPQAATLEEWEKLSELLQFNPTAAEYLLAEYNFTQLMDRVIEAVSSGAGMTLPGAAHEQEQ